MIRTPVKALFETLRSIDTSWTHDGYCKLKAIESEHKIVEKTGNKVIAQVVYNDSTEPPQCQIYIAAEYMKEAQKYWNIAWDKFWEPEKKKVWKHGQSKEGKYKQRHEEAKREQEVKEMQGELEEDDKQQEWEDDIEMAGKGTGRGYRQKRKIEFVNAFVKKTKSFPFWVVWFKFVDLEKHYPDIHEATVSQDYIQGTNKPKWTEHTSSRGSWQSWQGGYQQKGKKGYRKGRGKGKRQWQQREDEEEDSNWDCKKWADTRS